ncbi:electron transport complex protein RnfD [Buchnera aphidicola str. Bp (Baizongia pistaciae)]|uniref:Ion-translocating oxidoreductase complex subunit D n=1 Tax=Buchnera aphidicola subsp. Baizongia pistaciae (strain Bp) TaxID=224915 RepID=RNFD_BUCBP|nr:RnfABCDGE type electron transport complex subunit D [Buchnera aphidicola]Q89AW7.1 RecName: Full=Ion-translocating oxidoreductase complex subunit D; AltName: Full=Rnf electron transport complex subunit D [Buchnera aphidicola str. Bp (Baizongia pistaciae)]AAO26845.1 electron transport complex protein RnfD [Buchnera aphidicola str. Bp (Baizongia pistaciae)]
MKYMRHFLDFYHHKNTSEIMLLVFCAAVPGICTEIYYFGFGVLFQILLSVFFSVSFEFLVKRLRKQTVKSLFSDNSAAVTGVLIGISLPSLSPWWLSFFGAFFSIVIAKQIYGGLGNNIFNPAMTGYSILLVSFPILMTNWSFQNSSYFNLFDLNNTFSVIFCTDINHYYSLIDEFQMMYKFITQATPLEQIRTHVLDFNNKIDNIFEFVNYNYYFKNWKWISINISFLIGGIVLLGFNVICWRIPVSILFSLYVFFALDYYFFKKSMYYPIMQLFFGSTMFSVFFIATDPVTTSITKIGRIVFGCIVGFLIWLIRSFGNYPDAIAFSILLSNSIVPLIDHYTQPRVYGYVKKK